MRIKDLFARLLSPFQQKKSDSNKKSKAYSSRQNHILPHHTSQHTRRTKNTHNLSGCLQNLKKYYQSSDASRGKTLSTSKIFLLLGGVSFFLVISSTYYWIFESRYFLINSSRVIIESLDPFVDISRAYESIGSTYEKPLYQVKSRDISDMITTEQNHIQDVEVARLWPNGLQIILKSQKPIGSINFLDSQKRVYLSQNGVIMSPDPSRSIEIDERMLLPIIMLPHEKTTVLSGKKILRPILLENILRIQEFLKNNSGAIGDKKIITIHLLEEEQEIHLVGENIRIMLLADKSLGVQLRELTILMSDQAEAFKKALYIDMRVPRKAFVCSDQSLCSQNIRTLYPKYQNIPKTP